MEEHRVEVQVVEVDRREGVQDQGFSPGFAASIRAIGNKTKRRQ
jgi:hypothetical protein